jgi:hypothetical protein
MNTIPSPTCIGVLNLRSTGNVRWSSLFPSAHVRRLNLDRHRALHSTQPARDPARILLRRHQAALQSPHECWPLLQRFRSDILE